jgi:hypothetical protein
MQSFVIPAWMAGTQARKDACGDIHVSLMDSSTPCWNNAIEWFYLNDEAETRGHHLLTFALAKDPRWRAATSVIA